MIAALPVPAPIGQARPWSRALGWLVCLGPFFYLTYGIANELAARRTNVPAIVFQWEQYLPFLEWTIVPYWSINFFYAASLFVCATKVELEQHARRLLTAQVLAVICFILFPLRFSHPHPETSGVTGFLFDALTSFDKPFNQAPSLHIALLAILWHLYAKHLPAWAKGPLHLWFFLVGVSVLTTYQHHFFDIPTGALLGAFCLWLWPVDGPSPLARSAEPADRRRRVLAARYLSAAMAIAALALWAGGAALWLLWVSVSLSTVAAIYVWIGPQGFQKDANGGMSLSARMLLAPYLAGAFVNSRLWTRRHPEPVLVLDGVWLGRIPLAREAMSFTTVIDLCAELPAASAGRVCVPMLDLCTPSATQLQRAADAIAHARGRGPVLVCCALGYSRSAAAIATWLLKSGATKSAADAVEQVRRARPRIVVDAALRERIAAAAAAEQAA